MPIHIVHIAPGRSKRFNSFPKLLDQFWAPKNLVFNNNRGAAICPGKTARAVKISTQLHLVSRLRMCKDLPPLLHMPLLHAKGQLYFHFPKQHLPKTQFVFYHVSTKLVFRLISGFSNYVFLIEFLVMYMIFYFPGSTALVGQGLLIVEVPRSHSATPYSVGLLWTSDGPVAETST